jgi:lipopolysaccharide/colanic/teichoic acid biosynthesis glycosyltransferase
VSRTHEQIGRDVVKRATDLGVASLALLLTLPLQALISVIVWRGLGRPVIFRQVRPGRHGKPFVLYKFRTMREERPGERGNSDADRLTRIGSILRATSVDELPSLVNVVRGDMSLVGPRPLLMSYLPRYSAEQARRHEVRPGITGLAQINGRNAISWEKKLALDVEYVRTRSLVGDVRILLHTVSKVVSRHGISSAGHVTTNEFLGEKRYES